MGAKLAITRGSPCFQLIDEVGPDRLIRPLEVDLLFTDRGDVVNGTSSRFHPAQARKEAAVRQGMAAKALAGIRVVSHASSYLLWVPLGEDQRADRVSVELRRRGIAVATADAFATTAHVPHAVRIAMGSVTRRVLKEALVAVGDVIRADVS